MKAGEKKAQVYSFVISAILQGEYPPGTILSEKLLVEKLSVSKSPVREALTELCNEGILRNIPRFGYEVIKLTEEDIINIRNYRIALECEFLWHNGPTLTSEQLQSLRELVRKRQENSSDDTDIFKHWDNNIEFHLSLFSCYKNQYAYDALNNAVRHQTLAFAQFYWDKWRKSKFNSAEGYHEMILDKLEMGDIQSAIKALKADIKEYNGISIK